MLYTATIFPGKASCVICTTAVRSECILAANRIVSEEVPVEVSVWADNGKLISRKIHTEQISPHNSLIVANSEPFEAGDLIEWRYSHWTKGDWSVARGHFIAKGSNEELMFTYESLNNEGVVFGILPLTPGLEVRKVKE